MGKEMNLHVEGCSFLWLGLRCKNQGLKEITSDQDALEMALSVGDNR